MMKSELAKAGKSAYEGLTFMILFIIIMFLLSFLGGLLALLFHLVA